MVIKDVHIVVEENILVLAHRLEEVTEDEEPESRLRSAQSGRPREGSRCKTSQSLG
ncbi:hypothetical protein CBM2626_U50021 [Cupriavidus taiwanensis]|uniref:Uncharacterized protein n=1 Tax=Cupriavidus taiwanensis TaxID=164546 RepID=A0A375FMK3_9BURK|nr:hypothetical protein CBM2614_U50014 [Cupriavidus taiwanensis]SOZ73930.1 hypothetical protein CBM2615_U40022 [Cupriavidus taiwanensis]SOZ75407.1 hypothetical protein CBM2613_U40023 [Cupriavidus taiwanensis]SPA03917.1 hypothetical protein CBM2626_U50021 [Cupriavidus taiwanensis]SPA12891.1 hypothetical protein CBM2625_U50024 [Cupriavidus taiwanensis]